MFPLVGSISDIVLTCTLTPTPNLTSGFLALSGPHRFRDQMASYRTIFSPKPWQPKHIECNAVINEILSAIRFVCLIDFQQ